MENHLFDTWHKSDMLVNLGRPVGIIITFRYAGALFNVVCLNADIDLHVLRDVLV